MIRKYIPIVIASMISSIVTLILTSGGYLIVQRITKSDYDTGIAAYKRGHYLVALSDFESRAMQGDSGAQFCLAYMYIHGYGVKKPDRETARAWYTQAAEQGYPPAQNNLGLLFVRRADSASENTSYLKNLKIAEKWLTTAAEQGCAPAQYNLFLIGGENGVEWLKKAAQQGYARAQSQLGYLYELGEVGVVKDPEKAEEWFRKAADQGDVTAQSELGSMYYYGRGVAKDLTEVERWKEALYWYKDAADQDHAASQQSLAFMYYHGEGVDQNPEKAVELWEKAAKAKQGSTSAQNNLAGMYSRGEGMSKPNPEMSARWYLRAAQQGSDASQLNLGQNFRLGRSGVPEDKREAYYWYSLFLKNELSDGGKYYYYDEVEGASIYTDKEHILAKVTSWRASIGKPLSKPEKSKIQQRVDSWKPRIFGGAGTGFYIDKHHILTNAHVVTDDKGKALDEFRIPYRRVELLDGWNRDLDLALLYDERGNTNTATFRRKSVEFGEKMALFGYPQSTYLSYQGNVTPGIVSSTLYTVGDPQFKSRFQYTAPTQRGNSGGPVFDGAGNVIGVCTSQLPVYSKVHVPKEPSIGERIPHIVNLGQNINFAIKFNVVEDFLSDNGVSPSIADNPTLAEFLSDAHLQEKPVTDIPLQELRVKAKNFTVPLVCFKNKEDLPLEVEIQIEDLEQ